MSDIVVGTLSTRGWAVTAEEKIREVMNNYTEAGFSQSVLYQGNIKSLEHARFRTEQDMDALRSEVKKDLESLYGNIFPDGVLVNTQVIQEDESDVRYRLYIEVEVTEGENRYSIEKYVNVENKE
ncbi:hypothetical protein HOV30_gp027 [Erwinia phage Derbicus]|uniref:Uncharacterized protein n=2 Tax=Derbicusvirus derbicus TaxID=2734104 RepID=A0A482IJ65_9CAUD|nr:hypothetical protein BIZ82_gp027 [Erwinia phage vB_EamM_EarlPhillipIV]YP_009821071.1 hypothetical protein HOV30_gp027 [Erwinia phage Derbicus]ANZ48877.1 hypothetical protein EARLPHILLIPIV_27 [Erwinia phage vB_EamM_EarlPhillipIV]QBP07453.1 hypothetical protein DERBICUS_27 [Erwinia phage Derbicus]